jgi:hypothetical protein
MGSGAHTIPLTNEHVLYNEYEQHSAFVFYLICEGRLCSTSFAMQ